MTQRRQLNPVEVLATAKAQQENDYYLRFRRSTEGDSPLLEFTTAMVEAVARRLDPVATHRDYAKIVLGALNSGVISERQMALLTTGVEPTLSEKTMPVPHNVLTHYRRLLSEAADNPIVISPLTCAKLRASLAGRIIGVPVPEIGPNGALTSYRTVAANFESAFDHAALLLISDFAFQLRRCKLPSCQNLFLCEPGVKETPRAYCGEECRETIRKKERKEQVYAARAGVSVDQWRSILKKKGNDYKPAQYAAAQQLQARAKK